MLVTKCFFHTKLAIYSLQLLHPLIEHFLNLLDFFFWHSSDPVNTTLLAVLLFHKSALRRSAIHCCIVLKFQLFASLFCLCFVFTEAFSCLRLPTYSFNPPYWPNTGKFDKISFSLSADHKLLGFSVGSTAQQGIPVTLTIKVSNISGGVIASKTKQHTFRYGIPDYPVFFDQPILLAAGQQYIAASLVEAASMPELARSFDGSAIKVCNSYLTVTFSNVPAEEMADSNGSTVEEGQIIFLYFKPP